MKCFLSITLNYIQITNVKIFPSYGRFTPPDIHSGITITPRMRSQLYLDAAIVRVNDRNFSTISSFSTLVSFSSRFLIVVILCIFVLSLCIRYFLTLLSVGIVYFVDFRDILAFSLSATWSAILFFSARWLKRPRVWCVWACQGIY